MVASVTAFLNYVSRDDVKALAQHLICDDFDPGQEPWTYEVVYEEDAHERPVLGDLLRRMNTRGSIVVPTINDIKLVKNKVTIDLVQKIIDEAIPVVALNYNGLPEWQSLAQFGAGGFPDYRMFDFMVDNALRVRIELEFFKGKGNRKKMIKSYNKGIERGGRDI